MPSDETQFKKGQSGNPKGRPEGSVSPKAALKRLFRENPEKLEELIRSLYAKANTGDTPALKLIMESIDGKPHQSIDHTTDGQAIQPQFNVNVVDQATADNIKKLSQ